MKLTANEKRTVKAVFWELFKHQEKIITKLLNKRAGNPIEKGSEKE